MSAAPLLDVAGRIQRPTIFTDPRLGPDEVADFPALVARLRVLAGGRRIDGFRIGHAAYPDFEPFPCLTLRVGGAVVATIADRWRDEDDVRAAERMLRAAFQMDAAA